MHGFEDLEPCDLHRERVAGGACHQGACCELDICQGGTVPATYDEGQQNIAGQEEWKKPRTKSSSKEDEATIRCNPRARTTEATLRSRADTTTTIKQGLNNDCTRGGEEDVAVGQRKLTSSKVACDINRIFNSLGHLVPTAIKYERPLQELVQARLEWIEFLQTEPAAEEQASPKNRPSPAPLLTNQRLSKSHTSDQLRTIEADYADLNSTIRECEPGLEQGSMAACKDQCSCHPPT